MGVCVCGGGVVIFPSVYYPFTLTDADTETDTWRKWQREMGYKPVSFVYWYSCHLTLFANLCRSHFRCCSQYSSVCNVTLDLFRCDHLPMVHVACNCSRNVARITPNSPLETNLLVIFDSLEHLNFCSEVLSNATVT